jgi:hypothetical protein
MKMSGWMDEATGTEWRCTTQEAKREARKRLHARQEEQNEEESRERPPGVTIYFNLFSTRPPRGAGFLNSGEHARPAEEEEGDSGGWRAGEPCWRWRPAIANFPKHRIRSARHDSTRRRKFVLAGRQNQHARRARSPDAKLGFGGGTKRRKWTRPRGNGEIRLLLPPSSFIPSAAACRH